MTRTLLAIVCVLATACYDTGGNTYIIMSSTLGTGGGGGLPPNTAFIGPQGGTLNGSGKLAGVSIEFPKGALAKDTLIRLEPGSPVSTTRSLQVGSSFHVDAQGAQLAVPATVTIPYDQLALYGSYEGASEGQLWVLKQEDATGEVAWVVPASVDPTKQLVSVQVSNFSTFAGATAQPARYVYVSNFGDGTPQNIGDNTLSIYSVNNNTGRLRCVGYQYVGSTTAGPSPVTVNPSSTRVWVANFTSNTIIGYTIGTNGFLSTFSNSLSSPGGPVSFAITPDSAWAYTADFNNNTITAYQPGGTIAHYGAGTNPEWVAIVPSGINNGNGNFYAYVPGFGSNNVLAYQINDGNGQLTNIQTFSGLAANSNPIGAVVDPSARFLYVSDWTTGIIDAYSIAQTGGTAGQISLIAGGSTSANASVVNPIALTTDIFGSFVVTCNFGSNNVSSFTIGANGGLGSSPTSTASAGTGPNAIQRDPAGNYVFMVNQSSNEVLPFGLTRAGQTGAGTLTPGVKVRTQTLPTDISVSAGNAGVVYKSTFLYAARPNGSKIAEYSVANNGTLSSQGTTTVGNGNAEQFGVALDPQFNFLYITRETDGTAYSFSINNGALTQIGNSLSLGAGSAPTSIVCEASDRYAYILDHGLNKLYQMTIGGNGGLSLTSTIANVGTSSAQTIKADPTGRFLYVADGGSAANSNQESVLCYGISAATGGLTFMNQTFTGGHSQVLFTAPTFFPLECAVDSSGRFLYIGNMAENTVSEYSIDNTTGVLTSIGTVSGNNLSSPSGITANPVNDTLYVCNGGSTGTNGINSYSINTGTGALTFLGSATTGSGPVYVGCDISGAFAYVLDYSSGLVSEYTVSATNGNLTANGSVSVGGTPAPLAVIGTVQ